VTGLAVSTLLVPTGCSSATQTAEGFRTANREGVERLTIGMPRDEVISIMGTSSLRPLGTESSGAVRTAADTMGVQQVQIPLGARGPQLYNPMRSATYLQDDQTWEVLFYYTQLVEDDNAVTDDELTPVVLLDDYLAGVGWQYWRQAARDAGIDLELTTEP
jgi:hypothetical protein